MVKDVVNTQQEQQQYKAIHIPESNISDTPEPFGYNSTWLAIYGYTPHQVISTLNLKMLQSAHGKMELQLHINTIAVKYLYHQ